MMQAMNPIAGTTIDEMRAGMEADTAGVTLPEDVKYEAVDAGDGVQVRHEALIDITAQAESELLIFNLE